MAIAPITLAMVHPMAPRTLRQPFMRSAVGGRLQASALHVYNVNWGSGVCTQLFRMQCDGARDYETPVLCDARMPEWQAVGPAGFGAAPSRPFLAYLVGS
jgi:hypothetical protein